MNKKHKR